MVAPEVLDPRRHYARAGGMSEMERKMMAMIGSEDDEGDRVQKPEDQGYSVPTDVKFAFTSLPLEIVDRILTFALLPGPQQISQVAYRQTAFANSIVTGNAVPLCLVCRLFDEIVRPKMYRTVHIAHRKIRSLLRTLDARPNLRRLIRCCTLDSHIWTSDIDETVIARLLLALRSSCLALHVGANESEMLPYLLHGDPAALDSRTDRTPAALRSLYIFWRDEADYDPQAIRNEEEEEAAMIDGLDAGRGTGIQDAVSARQTLFTLFQHERDLSAVPRLKGVGDCMYAHLQHLTLNVYSHAQLDQLFLASGYFVDLVLPLLSFLRIELPLTVLQCSTAASGRGALAPKWPCRRFPLRGNRLSEMMTLTQMRNRKARSDGQQDVDDGPRTAKLAPCPSDLLRPLLARFALNVHRNDPTLFALLLDGADPACAQTWSTRGTIAARVLAQSLAQHLCGQEEAEAMICFPIEDVRERGMPSYWHEQTQELERAYENAIADLSGYTATAAGDVASSGIRVWLALRWPAAQEAFLRFSAMV